MFFQYGDGASAEGGGEQLDFFVLTDFVDGRPYLKLQAFVSTGLQEGVHLAL